MVDDVTYGGDGAISVLSDASHMLTPLQSDREGARQSCSGSSPKRATPKKNDTAKVGSELSAGEIGNAQKATRTEGIF